MKWAYSELISLGGRVEFDEMVEIPDREFDGISLINGTTDVNVSGSGYLDEESERFFVHLDINGVMLLPDAITNQEIEYPFETGSDEIYSFADTAEDGVRLVTDDVIELFPAVVDAIMLEVPLQVTVASSKDYPQGEDWRIISEEDYQKSRESEIDPRLAKLKDFKMDEE